MRYVPPCVRCEPGILAIQNYDLYDDLVEGSPVFAVALWSSRHAVHYFTLEDAFAPGPITGD